MPGSDPLLSASGYALAESEEREALGYVPTPEDGSGGPSCESRSPKIDRSALKIAFELPGHGSVRTPFCGAVSHHGHRAGTEIHYAVRSGGCGAFDCPRDYRWWIQREAGNVAHRLEAWSNWAEVNLRGALAGAPTLPGLRFNVTRPIHVAVSPATGVGSWPATLGEFQALRSRAERVLSSYGFLGGGLVPHSVRLPTPETGRFGCVKGFHFHALGFGWLRRTEPGEWSRSGWVVKNLGVRERPYVVAAYLLSHAARATPSGVPLPKGKSRFLTLAVSWFGLLATTQFSAEEMAEWVSDGPYCATCERSIPRREWFWLVWEGAGPPPEKPGVCCLGEWRVGRPIPDRESDRAKPLPRWVGGGIPSEYHGPKGSLPDGRPWRPSEEP